jgi:hypothetical protein
MTNTEKDLYNEKIAGVHAMIQANADVQAKVTEQVINTLDRIETQVMKTNVRVTRLENDKYKRTGITIAVSTIFSVAVTLFGFYLKYK